MHPEYLSTKYAYRYSEVNNIPLLQVQHHHAHLAACLADNEWDSEENVIGICLDGTGYGMDNQIWGGEILIGGYQKFQRKYHLEYMPLPGGDSAIFHPNRIAAAYLWKLGLPWDNHISAIKSLTSAEYAATTKAKRKGTKKGKQFVKQPKKIAKKVKQYRSFS